MIQFITIEMSEEQIQNYRWCQQHWQNIKALIDSKAFEIKTGNYTAHIKEGRIESIDINNRVNISN